MSSRAADSRDVASRLLLKGLEEEVYTGMPDGTIVGMSPRIAAELAGFATEPDARNVEYTTAPYRDYHILIDRLMAKRCALRRYLDSLDGYTLVPGSTLSLEPSADFQISKPENPYYQHIAKTYGTSVVTASTHINLGIEDTEELLRAYRVLRCEAPLFLSLTASSPFLLGRLTGYHSTRWHVFPHTPKDVPFFVDHTSFVAWVEKQIAAGVMFNPRHLWLAVRPNGPATPRELTRLELRACDRISRPHVLAAVTALFEARVWQVLEQPELDPLRARSESELKAITASNEEQAARSSLDGRFTDWRSGREEPTAEHVLRYYQELLPTATAHGFEQYLGAIPEILERGNLAQQWVRKVEGGQSPRAVLTEAIAELNAIDRQYDPECLEPGRVAV